MSVGNERAIFDVMIIGAGPAGLSAAIWCADLGLETLLLEQKAETGGQLLWTFNDIENYPGIIFTTGRELRDNLLKQVEQTGVTMRSSATIEQVDLEQRSASLEDGARFSARFIILATGVRRRTLNIPGEVEFAGRGVLSSGVRDRSEVAGKTVVIVGGGDAALENAIIVGAVAKHVSVVYRGKDLSARREFVESALKMTNVSLIFNTTPLSISGTASVESIEVLDSISGEQTSLPADAVLVRIGVTPNTELFAGQVDVDERGYVKVDVSCSTNVDSVFAIGDMTNCNSPTISTAAGMGATAAKAISAMVLG